MPFIASTLSYPLIARSLPFLIRVGTGGGRFRGYRDSGSCGLCDGCGGDPRTQAGGFTIGHHVGIVSMTFGTVTIGRPVGAAILAVSVGAVGVYCSWCRCCGDRAGAGHTLVSDSSGGEPVLVEDPRVVFCIGASGETLDRIMLF